MRIYFVRHASTGLVEKGIAQYPESPLNEEGLIQAQQIATRFKDTDLDLIITSPYLRALSTAQSIQSLVNTALKSSDLFVEIRKPSQIIGKSKTDPEVLNIKQQICDNFSDPNWHFSDEENFADAKTRGQKALKYLLDQNKENILVVTHSKFLILLISLMSLGDSLSALDFYKIVHFFRHSNTGVTICSYEDRWRLHTWNDTSHCL